MPVKNHRDRTTIDSVLQPVLVALVELTEQVRNGNGGDDAVANIRDLLETLPLSTEAFGLACKRLQNAQQYLQIKESGAAQWELKVLKSQLRSQLPSNGRISQRTYR